ncbi:uncharacterized protein A4U43_C01F21100 [Asparagus officinalis]|uniref:Uncharacterized protein n=1 Tax=Asparagus officinalis TaxID=4686 RepID=A0A5P1FVF4_ASPOF|nr:uncharacterized protein A4U43_C01F21100 [Asparagus officinalis]
MAPRTKVPVSKKRGRNVPSSAATGTASAGGTKGAARDGTPNMEGPGPEPEPTAVPASWMAPRTKVPVSKKRGRNVPSSAATGTASAGGTKGAARGISISKPLGQLKDA